MGLTLPRDARGGLREAASANRLDTGRYSTGISLWIALRSMPWFLRTTFATT
jgi:hypothetical protein